MEKKTEKAYERLKEFGSFSPNFETFEGLFWEQLDKSKSDIAIKLLLQVTFELLQSDGEVFNEVLARVDEAKRAELKNWITDTRSRL